MTITMRQPHQLLDLIWPLFSRCRKFVWHVSGSNQETSWFWLTIMRLIRHPCQLLCNSRLARNDNVLYSQKVDLITCTNNFPSIVPLTDCGDLIMILALPTKVLRKCLWSSSFLFRLFGYPIDCLPESQTPGTSVLFGMTQPRVPFPRAKEPGLWLWQLSVVVPI
jgi:hypothetical protein